MSLFDQAVAYGAQTTAAQAGDLSFGEKAVASGTSAVLSGLNSIYNTGVAAANLFGADLEEASTAEQLRSIDRDWMQFYLRNQSALDITGFIATSLVPGTLAVKGLNLLRTGENVGALGRSLNFFRTKQQQALERATAELTAEGGSAFARINRNKLAVMGWETADQALQATFFELGVALTMKQSPLLADDSWWEVGKAIATGAALGGGIGGGIGALGINRSFKQAIKAVDERVNNYSAITGVSKLNLPDGDKAYALMDAVTRLPTDVLETDKILNLTFQLGSGPVSKSADLTKVLTNTMQQSAKTAMNEFEVALRKLVSTEKAMPDVQQPYAEFILNKYTKLKAANAAPSVIREELGDQLWNLRRIFAATEEPAVRADDLFYFRKEIPADELKGITSIDQLIDATARSTPFGPDGKYKNAYIYMGEDLSKEQIAVVGVTHTSLKHAWDEGFDIALAPNGTLAINQKSGKWKQVTDPVNNPRRYLNTRTGAMTETTVLTAADRADAGTVLRTSEIGVEFTVGGAARTFDMRSALVPKGDLTYITARHAWAAALKVIPKQIHASDVSLLERLKTVPAALRDEYEIINLDNTISKGSEVEAILFDTKINGIRDAFLQNPNVDVRELAYRFNTTEEWIGKLVGSEFGATRNRAELFDDMSRNLSEFSRRENLVAEFTTPAQFRGLDLLTPKMTWREKRDLMLADVKTHGGQFVTGELAYAYRVKDAIRATTNAGAAVLGAAKFSLLPNLAQDIAKLANTLGAGSSFLGFSNASYGEVLKLASQNIGKFTHQWVMEASDDVINALSSVSAKIQANKKAAAELGIITNILRGDPGQFVWNSEGTLILKEVMQISKKSLRDAKIAELLEAGRRVEIVIESPEVRDFLRQHTKLNADRIAKETTLINARGFTTNKSGDVVYAPPIDTNYFQHFAFVRPIEGKAFSTSEVSMIFGRNAEELQQRIALVDRTQFDVIRKADGELYHKAKGDYDFDQTINERNIDSELRRTGALSNFFPETRAENILEDYMRWHQNKATRLVRNAVESVYAQQIEELRALGRNYAADATSKFSGTLKSSKNEINNPFDDYVKTMLDISKQSENQYRFFSQLNEFVDAMGTRAYQMLSEVTGKARQGLISWEEANKIGERYGIKGMYAGSEDYFISNVPRDRNLIKETVARANTLLANLVLRFDFAQTVMNVVSTPLLLGTELASIRTLVARGDKELAGLLTELTTVNTPGGGPAVPTTLKLLHNAVKNFHGANKEALLKRYKDNGDIKDTLALYQSALSDLALSPNFRTFSEGVERSTEKVATLTGNNWSEEFTRFVSADVMRQLTDPLVAKGLLDIKTQNSYISTFVNRVQGNYISSQRPVVFQGVLGGAISLFQTYSFNLLQQLLRHVENKDKRAIATLFGMQAGLFGLNGTPMFDAVNTHIIGNAAINDGHYDAYSIAPQLVGKEVGDWLMYGSVSAFPGFSDKWPALYTRGDINPRHMTILPLNPVDIPAIDASIRVVRNLTDIGSKLVGGADVSETLLQGLEHNGINRPIAGLAQVLAQQSTTSRGGLISGSSDMEGIAQFSRIFGAKPMDEAVALNNLYRVKAYQAADRERMEILGERVKMSLARGQAPTDEDLMQFFSDYTSIGGRPENFNAALQRWMKDANVSVIEKVRANINSEPGQRLNEIMGGVPLDDWRNQDPAQLEVLQP